VELFKLLHKKSKFFYVYLGFLAIINSIWASALLLFINNKIIDAPFPFWDDYDWLVYLALVIVSFVGARLFQAYVIKLTYTLGHELNLSIFNKLRFSTYEEYQNLGEDKVRTAMTDVTVLQRFPQDFIEVFNAGVMVFIGIVYLFTINFYGALLVLGAIVVLSGIYYIRNEVIEKNLHKVRDLANVYQQNVNDFLRGYKELKMDTNRSNILYNDYLAKNRTKVKKLTISTLTKHLVNELMANYSWYLMLGFILFVLPVLISITGDSSNIFIVTLLYLLGPVSAVVGSIHEFTKMGVSVQRLLKFNKTLNASEGLAIGHGDMSPINKSFESIRFENVTFEYFDKHKAKTFRLQPLNLTIRKGESIFVTGGNGSGKSTFIHLLSGLYRPISGKIFLNNHLITKENYAYYSNQISCIFTDNYLFSENYNGFDFEKLEGKLKKLIAKMQLTDIFSIEDNKVKTTLSKGQQKRVALIYALLEDKDVLILDEWAAEQDPVFRKYFYTQIVPELADMGKTVVAVTHDDAFFYCAKRLIKFNYGQITQDTTEVNKIAASNKVELYEMA